MIPSRFEYERAESVDHALELLRTKEDPKLLAGGHSLLPLMKFRLASPSTLVDVSRLADLRGVRDAGDHLAVGAMTRHHDLNHDPLAKEHCPIAAYAAGLVGDAQVRHRGTVGGSLAHGDPASDLPTICLTLDATMVARGPGGEREIPAQEFFKGYYETALGEDEMLTEIRLPKTGGAGWSYLKFRQRALDWATVGVAAVVTRSNGNVGEARIGFTNMGQTPLRAFGVERSLVGASGDGIAQVTDRADEGTDPPSDTWASADFRRHLARVLTRRAVQEALAT
jgi:carbon-monoxide dehydrogenase medium subunit